MNTRLDNSADTCDVPAPEYKTRLDFVLAS